VSESISDIVSAQIWPTSGTNGIATGSGPTICCCQGIHSVHT